MQGYIQKKLVTKTEAARLLGVCRHTIYAMIQDKRLGTVHITATQTRIKLEDVERITGRIRSTA